MTFERKDFVTPASVPKTALAIAERLGSVGFSTFGPTAGGAFTHATTEVSTLVGLEANSSFTTSMTSGALIIATSAMQDQINLNRHLINRIVYVLEANGMTT